MKIFYLDTTSSYLFAGICVDGVKLGEVRLKLDKDLSSFTLPEISSLFETCHLEPKEIDKLIVVNGPGSFTGIRIGVTIAKIYAWALHKEITTISSLEAMATSCEEEFDYIVPMIDARRDAVYSAIYTPSGEVVLEEQYRSRSALEEQMEKLSGRVGVITNDLISTTYPTIPYLAQIEKIANRYATRKAIPPHAVEPEYLKKTEAEESKK